MRPGARRRLSFAPRFRASGEVSVAILSLGKNSFKRKICELATETQNPQKKTQQRLFSFIDRATAVRVVVPFNKEMAQFSVGSVSLWRALRFVVCTTCWFLLAACTPNPPKPASPTIDDFGDTVVLGNTPTRIVSLNPATT